VVNDGSDAELVAAARAGDKRAFAALVERYHGVLLSTCRRATGDPDAAADAAQEAIVAALLGLDRLRDAARFGSWLVGIGLNLCRRWLAERARLAPAAASEPAADGPAPDEAAQAAFVAERVRAAIAALPAGQRAAVELFYLGGLSHAEVAGALGTRPGAVKTRLHKARVKLRRDLSDVREEPMAVPMHVDDVRRTTGEPVRHIVFLAEDGGDRRLPIWIGRPEATAIVWALEQVELPRPGPYHFAASLLTAAGGRLREVRVSRLAESTFYARAILDNGAEIDARPSDAITLALVAGAPILVEPEVFDEAGRTEAAMPELVAEALDAPDDARALADEERARIAAMAREIAELNERRAGA
jgi:RNA polymerase sigma factor (sigma-70 family)